MARSLNAVAVVVADGDLGHASADLDLARGLERAVAVADHDGDQVCGDARRREAGDVVGDDDVEPGRRC